MIHSNDPKTFNRRQYALRYGIWIVSEGNESVRALSRTYLRSWKPHQNLCTLMEAVEYLYNCMRTVPGGAIAWRRSIFEECRKWEATELIDAAVDIAWATLYPEAREERTKRDPGNLSHRRQALVIRRSGSFIVFSLRSDIVPQFLNQAA